MFEKCTIQPDISSSHDIKCNPDMVRLIQIEEGRSGKTATITNCHNISDGFRGETKLLLDQLWVFRNCQNKLLVTSSVVTQNENHCRCRFLININSRPSCRSCWRPCPRWPRSVPPTPWTSSPSTSRSTSRTTRPDKSN